MGKYDCFQSGSKKTNLWIPCACFLVVRYFWSFSLTLSDLSVCLNLIVCWIFYLEVYL